ncbi:variant erythrocyte surface antigen-1 family protein [Babesia caballi]|uniref:Variant erythrocyte surface antigen-1 family protein n=1 Tax=Babesia caballi TaxID=5871 RepID=A0AAV4LY97_BABCB|nr:variant erythrocyte surface antigen-1 family protein [Babesia caballi]
MKMTSGGKSLTDPPKDLKEAIDWVLRAIKGLAEEVKKLLNKDASEVARGVLGVMGKSITDLANKLAQVTEQVQGPPSGTRKPFKVLVSYLQTFKGNLENVRDYGSRVSEQDLSKLKGWLTGESGPITQLAEGLRKFLGYQSNTSNFDGTGIILNNGQAYDKAYGTASWPQSPDDKRTCALIFLGIGPMLFYGLTYLYWWCEGNDGWSKEQLTGSSTTLSKYMTAIGFDSKYLSTTQNTGSQVAEILKTAFQKELTDQKVKTQSHYEFQESLSQEARGQASPSTEYPLSRCHVIATPFFTPNDTYDVQSTSPATSSFLGYSGTAALAVLYPPLSTSLLYCLSNLKEAIDWILRVTGKDGGSNKNVANDLTEQVKKLLDEVKDVDRNLGEEIGKVVTALTKGNGALITKLAEGLQQFIGYDNRGKLTGGGILPANVATHQVCNAVLNFVIRFLEGLCGFDGVGDPHKQKVLEVIGKLRKCLGTGKVPEGFQQLVDGIAKKVEDLNRLPGNVNNYLKDVFGNLKTLVDKANLENGGSGSVEAFKTNVESFLDEVIAKVNGENPGGSFSRFTSLCTKLSKLIEDRNIKNDLTTTKIP